MHKKLESDLISLAHSILQMKNKDNVFLLKQKSKEIYEKLSVLAFVEEYVNATPNLKQTKEEVLLKVEKAFGLKESVVEKEIENAASETIVHNLHDEKAEILEQPFDELEEILASEPAQKDEVIEDLKTETKEEVALSLEDVKEIVKENNYTATNFKDDPKDVGDQNSLTLEEELKDTISVDEMATLFDIPLPKSLNDKLSTNIQIGLNDRIAFVKNLFDGSQEDFNRVVSQLNTYSSEKEAKKFINKMVKPDYNWSDQVELEARFMEIVERKFM